MGWLNSVKEMDFNVWRCSDNLTVTEWEVIQLLCVETRGPQNSPYHNLYCLLRALWTLGSLRYLGRDSMLLYVLQKDLDSP